MQQSSPTTLISDEDSSLDESISRAWTAAYAGRSPAAPLSQLRRQLQEAACASPRDADAIARAFEKLLQAWDDFPAEVREEHLAPLFTPTVIATLPDDLLRSLLTRALPSYPGRKTSLVQVLEQELELRTPFALDQALSEVFATADEDLLAVCLELNAAYDELLERWKDGCHLVAVKDRLSGMRSRLEGTIQPHDVSALHTMTDSVWQLLLRRMFARDTGKAAATTPREALERFRSWLEAQASANDAVAVVNRKDALRQALGPMDRMFKKFMSVRTALAHLERRTQLFAQAWEERRKIHDPAQDGFVLRDKNGQTIEILDIIGLRPDAQVWLNAFCDKDAARDAEATTRHLIDEARPFLLGRTPPPARARLYDAVACRAFTPQDCRHPAEAALVGQNMVVAARDLAPWTCLGAYGGVLLREDETTDLDRSYFFTASVDDAAAPRQSFSIDGFNVMCRMNTTVAYDVQGRPTGQAERDEEYNVISLMLRVRLGENIYGASEACVPAFFNLEEDDPIAAGEELRLDYHYTPSMVQDL